MTFTSTEPCTPIYKASFNGDLDAVTRLLDSGVDYLQCDIAGKTALHWAVTNHQLSVVNKLLEHHGHAYPSAKVVTAVHTVTYHDLKCFDSRARATITPIELAAQVDDEAIFKALLDHLEPLVVAQSMTLFNSVWPPLVSRNRQPKYETSDRVLFRNDDFPSKEEPHHGFMNYILRLALKDDKFKVVEMLLRLGTNPNTRYGKSPYLPLEVAAKCLLDAAYIRLLLKYGANPNPHTTYSPGKATPLSLAVLAYNEEGVIALINGGASVNATNGFFGFFGRQLSQVCDIVPFREQVKFDPDLPLRIFCALLDAGAVVDAACLHSIVRTMGCLPFLKELVLRGVDITLSPCALNSLRPSSSPEVYRETLDIFASAYGTLSSLRTALLTHPQRVRHNILLSYGLDADRPVGQSHLKHLGRTLVSKLLPGDIETSIESACNGFLHDDTFRLLCKNVEKAVTTPKQLELFQGTLRVLDHAGYLNPEVVTEQLFHLVESRNSEDFELEGVLEGLLDMGAGMYLFNPRYNILYPCQENFSDVLALAAIHGKERILSFLLQKLPWPPASASQHPAWPSWFQQEEFDSLRLVYRNNVDTTLACLASSKPLFTPRLADCGCPLLVAVDRGDVHAVKTLIALGVDVNKKGQSGWTPLHAAARGDHAAIAEVLLQANASVNALAHVPWRTQDRLGPADSWTPLHAAALRGNLQVIKKLLEYGVDIHIAECCTGAERGVWAPRRALDVVLLSGAVDADHTEDYRKRLLHPDRLTAALLLIERGASISARVAVDWKSFELDEILEYFGEHPSLWDKFVAEDWGDVDEREL